MYSANIINTYTYTQVQYFIEMKRNRNRKGLYLNDIIPFLRVLSAGKGMLSVLELILTT
ncbi:hypothetical protein PAGU1678_10030 [Paraclostridium bifermentans subsp. muricolitidis]|nr:hypothetical protein PAGU1678_10030 [Paraclostridium bifermentans subsp. muricolitidis]